MAILNGANGVQAIEPYEGSVALNKTSITLKEVGETIQLTATTDPVELVNKGLTWTSSDTSVATVSSTGLVSCVEPGECTITVMTNAKRYTATCAVSEATTEGWFFYSDGVYYGDKSNHKQTKISSYVFNSVLYDRKYDKWYGRSGNTCGKIKSDFSGFEAGYTMYDAGDGSVVIKGEYVVMCGKSGTSTSSYRWSKVFRRSTGEKIYDSGTSSGSYQYDCAQYSYIPTEHRYVGYGTGNSSYAYIVDLANNNSVITRSWGYNQAETFNDKVLLLSENNTSIGLQIRNIDNDSTLASQTGNNWGAPVCMLYDSGLTDDYSSSDPMYGKIGVIGVRSNYNVALVDMVNNTINVQASQSSGYAAGIFIPYTAVSGYTHICCWSGNGQNNGFALYNSSNNTVSKIENGGGNRKINVMSDGSIFYGGTGTIYDIDTKTTTTYSGLYGYVGLFPYKA